MSPLNGERFGRMYFSGVNLGFGFESGQLLDIPIFLLAPTNPYTCPKIKVPLRLERNRKPSMLRQAKGALRFPVALLNLAVAILVGVPEPNRCVARVAAVCLLKDVDRFSERQVSARESGRRV